MTPVDGKLYTHSTVQLYAAAGSDSCARGLKYDDFIDGA